MEKKKIRHYKPVRPGPIDVFFVILSVFIRLRPWFQILGGAIADGPASGL